MGNPLATVFEEIGNILGVCPCCGELFYLSESRPYLIGHQPTSVLDKMRAEERRLEKAEERLQEIEAELREAAAKAGLRTAKKLLKKIDPIFSGVGHDPQDVKVIFNPVSYLVFSGMARDKLKKIILLDREAEDAASERVQRSIERTIDSGNLEFRTLRIDSEGNVHSK